MSTKLARLPPEIWNIVFSYYMPMYHYSKMVLTELKGVTYPIKQTLDIYSYDPNARIYRKTISYSWKGYKLTDWVLYHTQGYWYSIDYQLRKVYYGAPYSPVRESDSIFIRA